MSFPNNPPASNLPSSLLLHIESMFQIYLSTKNPKSFSWLVTTILNPISISELISVCLNMQICLPQYYLHLPRILLQLFMVLLVWFGFFFPSS